MSLLHNPYYKKKLADWKKIEKKLQVADIILIKDKKFILSKYIEKATKSYWSHVALVFAIPDKKLYFNDVLIVEALRGIEIHRLQTYTGNLKRFDIGIKRVPNLNENQKQKIIAFMLNNVDVPYDYFRLIGTLASILNYDFFDRRRDFFINKDLYVCSTFTQKAFWQAVPKHRKEEVFFEKKNKSCDLENIYPGDIAKSDKCHWIYNQHD